MEPRGDDFNRVSHLSGSLSGYHYRKLVRFEVTSKQLREGSLLCWAGPSRGRCLNFVPVSFFVRGMQELIIDTWQVSKLSTISSCLYIYFCKFITRRKKERERKKDGRIFFLFIFILTGRKEMAEEKRGGGEEVNKRDT